MTYAATPSGTGPEALLWLLVLLPAAAGAVLALGAAARFAVPVSLGSAGSTAALSVVVAVERARTEAPFMAGAQFGLQADSLAAVVAPTVAVVTLLVLVLSAAEIHEAQARFHGLMLLFASAALLTTVAATLPALLFAWEVMGATSYALIGFWWRDDVRVSGGLTAFLTTRTADVGLYVAAGAALAGGSDLDLGGLDRLGPGWRGVVAGGVLVAALGKAAQLPFSFWLSRAMEGPSPVSALLHSAAMVAMGGYLLLRVEPLLAATSWAGPVAAWAGAATVVLLGAVAVAQRDLKQLLAASTCAQLGFVVMAAGVGTVAGGTAHLVAHAATKALLFLAAGVWLTALGTKRLAGLRGVARRWPVVGWAATVGALALAGIPPLSLWATKDAVLGAALEESAWLYGVGLVGTALSAAYSTKVLVVLWRRADDADEDRMRSHLDEEQTGTREVGGWEKAPLVVLAVGAATLGVLALPPLDRRLAHALGEAAPDVSVTELAVSAGVAIAVALLVARWAVPEPGWAQRWLGLEPAAHALVVRPVLRCAGALARFDDRAVDGAVDAAARGTLAVAGRAATADDRWVDGVVERTARGARRLGQLARRPQTGQLHQYYLQAAAVVAVGLVVLVVVR